MDSSGAGSAVTAAQREATSATTRSAGGMAAASDEVRTCTWTYGPVPRSSRGGATSPSSSPALTASPGTTDDRMPRQQVQNAGSAPRGCAACSTTTGPCAETIETTPSNGD